MKFVAGINSCLKWLTFLGMDTVIINFVLQFILSVINVLWLEKKDLTLFKLLAQETEPMFLGVLV